MDISREKESYLSQDDLVQWYRVQPFNTEHI